VAFPDRVETERLVLRRWREDDRAAWAAIWADPDVRSALSPPPDEGFADWRLERHLRHWELHGFGLWAIEVGGEVAGFAGLSHPDFVAGLDDAVEVGWTLRRPFWGRGYATEAAGVAIEAAFAHIQLDELISLIAADNLRSIAVARRVGMRHDRDVLHATLDLVLGVYVTRRTTGSTADR
jgi:RimJ/RimL family protein N-acetyltransferase